MKYFNFGINEIREDKFNPIDNSKAIDDIKPIGGLWATKHNEEYKDFNKWIDFILYYNKHLFFYKYNKADGLVNWHQPCSLITLTDKANLFNLTDIDKYNYLLKKYPYDNNRFSYKDLSKNYDGLYIEPNRIENSKLDDNTKKKINKFGLDSLVLFNLDCIDYYQKGIVSIEPFEYECDFDASCCGLDEPQYEINISNEKKKILKR